MSEILNGMKAKITKDGLVFVPRGLSPAIIKISPLSSDSDLLRKYRIRDSNDLKTLYSVEVTHSAMLVTMDEDLSDAEGLKAEIMNSGMSARR